MVHGSITGWIDRLKAGDRAAASPLWDTYFRRLVQFARERLRGASRRVADEEDAALSAFDSFCSAAACGRFPQLADRRSLWPLLAAITRHKCSMESCRSRNCSSSASILVSFSDATGLPIRTSTHSMSNSRKGSEFSAGLGLDGVALVEQLQHRLLMGDVSKGCAEHRVNGLRDELVHIPKPLDHAWGALVVDVDDHGQRQRLFSALTEPDAPLYTSDSGRTRARPRGPR